jgi:protocatechuate 3,4-dioxygenase beta subunit
MPRDLVTAILIAGFCQAQPPGAGTPGLPKPPSARLEGRVVHALTGEPLRKVKLTLQPYGNPGAGFQTAVASDEEGRFAFDELEPGNYLLRAARMGFLPAPYGARRPGSPGTGIALAEGQTLRGIEFRLTPQAVVSGRILDEDGDPVEGAQVFALLWTFRQNRRELAPVSSAAANDKGEYRLTGLPAGKYYLSASLTNLEIPAFPGPGKFEENYAATYYPGVADPSAAAQIEVGAGAEISGMGLRLLKSRVFRVSGKVAPAKSTRVVLIPRDFLTGAGAAGGLSRLTDAEGKFELAGVFPGSYYVAAGPPSGMFRVLGRTPVEVTDRHVRDVAVTVFPPAEVRGSVRFEGQEKCDLRPARVHLFSPISIGNTLPAQLKDDGTFLFENVARERFSVVVAGAPGCYVKRILAGETDITAGTLDLTGGEGAPAIEVLLSTKVASVAGTVVRPRPDGPPGTVYLLPEGFPGDGSVNPFLRVSALVDQNGRFEFRNLRPGQYRLYAFDEVDAAEIWNPEFLKAHESKAKKIDLAEGERKTVDPVNIASGF